jgi:hypothetical protein
MKTDSSNAPIVFISYSTKDDKHLSRLLVHLALLKRENKISEWHGGMIRPGEDWEKSITEQLERAKIILLLVSADFMASDFIWGVELRRALEKSVRDEAVVIPVIVSPVGWHTASFGRLQALPDGAKPITRWGNRDQAWESVASGLRAVIDQLQPSEVTPISEECLSTGFSKLLDRYRSGSAIQGCCFKREEGRS